MEINFQIGEDSYEIPEVINLRTFERIMAWDLDNPDHHMPIVSVVTGCPLHLISSIEPEVLNVILAILYTKLSLDNTEPKRTVTQHYLKDFNDLSFGDFIDLDVMIQDRFACHVIDIVNKIYGIPQNAAERLDISECWGAILSVVNWRNNIYTEYAEFFETDFNDEEDTPKSSLSNLQLMWYNAILVLAEGKFLDIHKVVERPVREALNYLTWKKNEIAKQKLEQVRKKHELSRRS